MKILVTGGAGYIGSVLCPMLLNKGYEVRVLDNLTFGANGLFGCFSYKKFDFIEGDILNQDIVAKAVEAVDVIIHLAAIVGYPACRRDEDLAYRVNVMGTKNIANAMRPNQKIIFSSTGSNYGTLVDNICTEETPLNPLTCYGVTKTEAERHLLNNVPTVAFRFATAFGVSPRFRLDLMINDFVYQALHARNLIIYEKTFKRTFIHVYDMARAFIFALENLDRMTGQVYNVGSESMNYTKEDVAMKVKSLLENRSKSFYLHFAEIGKDEDQRNYEVSYQKITEEYFATNKPDIVIHLAAYYGGLKIHDTYPATIYHQNLMMNTNLMHSAWKNGVIKFVSMGSDCSYPGYLDKEVLKEEDIWMGPVHDTTKNYGYLKKMNSVMGWCYKKQYGFNSIHLVMTNMFGPGDKFNPKVSHVVAALIKKFVDAKQNNISQVEIWGSGKPTRQFLYVEDAVDGILLGTEKYNDPEPLNVSTKIGARTIKELAETIKKVVGYKGDLIYNTSKPDGQMKKILDVSKMIEAFGWEPQITLEEGLRKTIEWYLANKEDADTRTH